MATLRNRLAVSVTLYAHEIDPATVTPANPGGLQYSMMLPPRSVHNVDDKFLWNLPQGVSEVKAASVLAQQAPQANVSDTTPASDAGSGPSNRPNSQANVTLSVAPGGSPVP